MTVCATFCYLGDLVLDPGDVTLLPGYMTLSPGDVTQKEHVRSPVEPVCLFFFVFIFLFIFEG